MREETCEFSVFNSDADDLSRFMTMPVQFEVYTGTKLLWDIRYDNATSEHVFTGRLLMSNGTAVSNQAIKLFLNETQVTTITTNGTGFVEYRRHFDPSNESDTWAHGSSSVAPLS